MSIGGPQNVFTLGGAGPIMGEDRAPEDVLLGRFRAGDEQAFCLLFDPHVPALRALIERRLPARMLRRISVADVIQETRIVAAQKLAEFAPLGDGALRGWLLAIGDRKILETLRRHGGAARRAVGREVTRTRRADTACHEAPQDTPSKVAMAHEDAVRVQAALQALPADYRAVLSLAHEHHRALREVADRMGRSREAVKKLYGRALCRFKEVYGKLGEDA